MQTRNNPKPDNPPHTTSGTSGRVAGFNDVRIKEKPIKEKTFKETDE